MRRPGTTSPWLRKYIFPGAYAPALTKVLAAVERQYLWVTDMEILRLHYADTLCAWRVRFDAAPLTRGYIDEAVSAYPITPPSAG